MRPTVPASPVGARKLSAAQRALQAKKAAEAWAIVERPTTGPTMRAVFTRIALAHERYANGR